MNSKIFVTTQLDLPEAPEGHTWQVESHIKIKTKKTVYSFIIRLFDENERLVLLHKSSWDRGKELLNDFLSVLIDETTRALIDYSAYKTIDWQKDNPDISFNTHSETEQASINETILKTFWEN